MKQNKVGNVTRHRSCDFHASINSCGDGRNAKCSEAILPKGVFLTETIPSKFFSPIDGEVFVVHCASKRRDSAESKLSTNIFVETP